MYITLNEEFSLKYASYDNVVHIPILFHSFSLMEAIKLSVDGIRSSNLKFKLKMVSGYCRRADRSLFAWIRVKLTWK